jgi:hypothetical protein
MMPMVEVIGLQSHVGQATRVVSALQAAGLASRFTIAVGERRNASLMIAFTQPFVPEIALEIGCRAGTGLPLLLLGASHDQQPSLLRGIPCLDPESPDIARLVVGAANRLLGIRQLPGDVENDADSLMKWLTDDWTRLDQLESRHLVDIVQAIFLRSGFATRRGGNASEPDLWMESPEHAVRWMVHCTTASAGEPIGIGAVQRLHSACVRSRTDFAMLVSNAGLTPAAKAWAAECAPPVHVLERTQLEALLKDAVLSEGLPSARSREAGTPSIWTRAVAAARRMLNAPDASRAADAVDLVRRVGGATSRSPWEFDLMLTECGVGPERSQVDNARRQSDPVVALRTELESQGVRLWQRRPDAALTLRDLEMAAKRSGALVLLSTCRGRGTIAWDQRIVQVIAHEVAHQKPSERKLVFVVAPNNAFSHLRLPTCMADATFVDSEDSAWRVELERQIASRLQSRWKDESSVESAKAPGVKREGALEPKRQIS